VSTQYTDHWQLFGCMSLGFIARGYGMTAINKIKSLLQSTTPWLHDLRPVHPLTPLLVPITSRCGRKTHWPGGGSLVRARNLLPLPAARGFSYSV
jgi:hypothetical protein